MDAHKIDPKQIKTQYEKPGDNPLEGMSNQDIQELLEYRSEVLMEINEQYAKLVECIYKMPFHVIYRNHAFMNIDQGIHWCKTAVDNIWEIPKAPAENKDTEEAVGQAE